MLTFLRRDLHQAIWMLLLGDDFLRAWQYGLVIKCGDGIWRRVYPRFFSAALDYLEK